MADYITAIRTVDGDKQIDYNSLANLPDLSALGGDEYVTTGGTGEAYTATIAGITELKVGTTVHIIPHVPAAIDNPTLNVNGLGAVEMGRAISGLLWANGMSLTKTFTSLLANRPYTFIYTLRGLNDDQFCWVMADNQPAYLNDEVIGILDVDHGGTGADTAAGAIKALGAAPAIQYGTTEVADGDTSEYPEGTLYVVIEATE